MNSAFTPPSEDDVRRAYKIPNEIKITIEIREAPPTASWLKTMGGFLEQAADYFEVPTFFLKARTTGIILAIFFIPAWGPKAFNEFKDAAIVSADTWFGKFHNLPPTHSVEVPTNWAIVTPTANTVSQILNFSSTGHLSAGTAFYPISGDLG